MTAVRELDDLRRSVLTAGGPRVEEVAGGRRRGSTFIHLPLSLALPLEEGARPRRRG